MNNLIGIVLLSTLIEGLITYLFGKTSEEQPARPWLKYISLVFGILVSFAYRVDIIAMTGLVSVYPFVGYIMSGLIIGRGANYLNDIFSLIKGKGSSTQATTVSIPAGVGRVTATTDPQ